MGLPDEWRELSNIVRRMKGAVGRGHLTRDATTGNVQRYHLQSDFRDENDIEVVHPAGFSTRPKIQPGKTEFVALRVGGDSTKMVIAAILQPADVARIADDGCMVIYSPDNKNIFQQMRGDKIEQNGNIEHAGDMKQTGNSSISGNLQCDGTFRAGKSATFESDVVINGSLNVDGTITCSGINCSGVVRAAGFVET